MSEHDEVVTHPDDDLAEELLHTVRDAHPDRPTTPYREHPTIPATWRDDDEVSMAVEIVDVPALQGDPLDPDTVLALTVADAEHPLTTIDHPTMDEIRQADHLHLPHEVDVSHLLMAGAGLFFAIHNLPHWQARQLFERMPRTVLVAYARALPLFIPPTPADPDDEDEEAPTS